MSHKPVAEVLGLDVGEVRIGVARASTTARLAEPFATISSDDAMPKLQAIIDERNIKSIVVGLPRNLDGDDTPQTTSVRDWVQQAKLQIELPFYWQDEALTSKKARQQQATSNKQQATFSEDAEAAAIILQDWLDSAESEKVLA